MPTASVGAPPVRDRMVDSPTWAAIWSSITGVTVKPQPEMASAASLVVEPIRAAGLLSAKYTAGSSTEAAISAIIATKLSISMAP